jgi:hypothetical protein
VLFDVRTYVIKRSYHVQAALIITLFKTETTKTGINTRILHMSSWLSVCFRPIYCSGYAINTLGYDFIWGEKSALHDLIDLTAVPCSSPLLVGTGKSFIMHWLPEALNHYRTEQRNIRSDIDFHFIFLSV